MTIGLDLGDRSSFYCVLNSAGEVILEERVATNPEAIKIDANVREWLMRATEDLWKRLREVVAHMVERLNEPESRFHGSLVTNVLDLVDWLPRLNVNGDANLNRFAEQISKLGNGFVSTPPRSSRSMISCG